MLYSILLLILFAGLSVEGQFNSYAIETGNIGRTFTTQNCPQKCRCMGLNHMELRFNSKNWKQETLFKENGYIPYKLTYPRGTDVICSGLAYVPWGLPTGKCDRLRRFNFLEK